MLYGSLGSHGSTLHYTALPPPIYRLRASRWTSWPRRCSRPRPAAATSCSRCSAATHRPRASWRRAHRACYARGCAGRRGGEQGCGGGIGGVEGGSEPGVGLGLSRLGMPQQPVADTWRGIQCLRSPYVLKLARCKLGLCPPARPQVDPSNIGHLPNHLCRLPTAPASRPPIPPRLTPARRAR